MGRLIINYRDMEPAEALEYARAVVDMGRVSNDGKCFCFATRFSDGIITIANKTKRDTDTLDIFRKEEGE